MRALILITVLAFAISACGKKAPLRAPDEPETQSMVQ